MLNLIPAHTKDFDYLYRLVSDRNKWFIKLRYGAVIMLTIFFLYLQFFNEDKGSEFQNTGILVCMLIVLGYNLFFDLQTRKLEKQSDANVSEAMRTAFVQIVCDLLTLLALVYVTGLLESPFSLFFVFHAIIASMILPGRIVTGIFITLLLIFSILVILVNSGAVPYFDILAGDAQETMSIPKTIVHLFAFWLMLLMSVKFSNNLASAHFMREQELNEALKKIETAELEKQNYVMAVVHEIKSPIAAISSYLNILLGGITGELSEKVKDILKKSKARADDAIVLTNDILDVSRVKLLEQIKKEQVYLEKIVMQTFESMRSKVELKNISLEFEEMSDQCRQVFADKRLMELVISNIISNAVKYTPEGGKVLVQLNESDENINIAVSDTGIGIPPDEMKNIYSEFYRASNAKKSNVEGTGLGLATVKRAVEKHGGTIHIISPGNLADNNNPGTTVFVSIPVNSKKE
jgi:signal transduction histidine kinase